MGKFRAQLRAGYAAQQQKRGQNNIHCPRCHAVHHRRRNGDEQDLKQRRPDHHLRPHAEQIKHGRHHDKPPTDTQQHGQYAGEKTENERSDGRNIEAGPVKAPSEWQIGNQRMMAPLPRRQRLAGTQGSDALQGFLEHQTADARQHQDI